MYVLRAKINEYEFWSGNYGDNFWTTASGAKVFQRIGDLLFAVTRTSSGTYFYGAEIVKVQPTFEVVLQPCFLVSVN